MLSLNSIKKIKSLKTKKGRDAEKLFLIEGKRSVEEYLLKSNLVNEVLISESKIKNYNSVLELCNKKKIKISLAPDNIFRKISDTKTPSGLLATCKSNLSVQKNFNSSRWLFLYKIKDPGNLGTILRSAAWFNIKDIALIRIEQLYPFPYDDLEEILTKYENVQEFVWCQEEPLNQGAWFSHRHRIQRVIDRIDTSKEVSLVSRPAAAAPAVGLMKLHLQQQEELVNKALIK